MKKVMIDGTPVASSAGPSGPTRLDTLTGEQFKQLIEQFDPDGKIDTVPELIAALDGIPEGMTVAEYVREHGGGTPAPGSVGMEELSGEVKDTMVTGADRVSQADLDRFIV